MDAKDIILTVTGIWNLSLAMVLRTPNAKSAIVFKVVPFLSGLSCLYVAWVL